PPPHDGSATRVRATSDHFSAWERLITTAAPRRCSTSGNGNPSERDITRPITAVSQHSQKLAAKRPCHFRSVSSYRYFMFGCSVPLVGFGVATTARMEPAL